MRKFSMSNGLTKVVRGIGPPWSERIDWILQLPPFQGGDGLRAIAEELERTAENRKAEYAEEKVRSWKAFVDHQLKCGAGAAHRIAKRDRSVSELGEVVGKGNFLTISPQAVVDGDAEEWSKIWCRSEMSEDEAAPWRSYQIDDDDQVEEITGEMVYRAACSFSNSTAMGMDAVPPRFVAFLSRELLSAIAAFLNRVEVTGKWPDSDRISTAVMHLIPKAGGGRRPIAVLPALVRIWERVRKSTTYEWAEKNVREYNWAAAGRSAEDASWHLAIRDEAYAERGDSTASVMLDLTKAFDHVKLKDVWRAGVSLGFSPRVLRAVLEAYCFRRRLAFSGAYSRPITTFEAILPGSVYAQTSLFMVLMLGLDDILKAHSSCIIRVMLYVDDIAIHAAGKQAEVAKEIQSVTNETVHLLENVLGLKVSRKADWSRSGEGKSEAATSSVLLCSRIATGMKRLGIRVRGKVKHLGVAFRPGGNRARSSVRWIGEASRRKRVSRMGKRLGGHIARTAVVLAVTYGCALSPMPRRVMRGLRAVVANTGAKRKGVRSTAARLAVCKSDPAMIVATKAVMAWWKAVWSGTVTATELALAWRATDATGKGKPAARNLGVAGAYVEALASAEWTAPSPTTVRARCGTIIDLNTEAPRSTMRFFKDDYAIVAAANSSTAARMRQASAPLDSSMGQQEDAPVPWFEPAAMVVASTWARRQPWSAVESAIALVEGAWWSQQRLYETGLAEHPFCTACGETAVGSVYHRLARCPASQERREASCPGWLERKAKENERDPLFNMGVPARPTTPEVLEAVEWEYGQPLDGATVCGEVYTDGALKGLIGRARRSAWAFAVPYTDEKGRINYWGKIGTINERYPTVLRAELHAVLGVLRVAHGPVRIHTDSQLVVDGFRNGRAWCTRPQRDGADLWVHIWRILRDIGGCQIVKVKAHLPLESVREGAITIEDWAGNAQADLCAKAGCKVAAEKYPTTGFYRKLRTAVAWFKWIVRHSSEWVDDVKYDDRRTHRERQPRQCRLPAPDHDVWTSTGRCWCRMCGYRGRWDGLGPAPRKLRVACRSSVAERVGSRATPMAGIGDGDTGRISLEFLRSIGAKRWDEPVDAPGTIEEEPRTDAPRETYIPHDTALEDGRAPAEMDEEEDPFGYGRMDVDGNTIEEGHPMPPESDPQFVEASMAVKPEKMPHETHRLVRIANLVWCAACGRHAEKRLGIGLLRPCPGAASGVYPSRLRRLRSARHPITGENIL